MKRSEIAMIVLIASLSMLLTFTLAQSLLGDKVKRKAYVEQTNKISENIETPAKRVFNKDAINPTVEVCVEKSQDADGNTSGSDKCQGSDTQQQQGNNADSTDGKDSTNSGASSGTTSSQSGSQSSSSNTTQSRSNSNN